MDTSTLKKPPYHGNGISTTSCGNDPFVYKIIYQSIFFYLQITIPEKKITFNRNLLWIKTINICAKIKIKSLSIFSSWTLFQWITDYLSCFLRQLFQYFSPCDEYFVDGFLQLKLISLQYQSSLFKGHFHYQVESVKILRVP